jgi:chaperonin GroES
MEAVLDRVIIEPFQPEEKTSAGIIIVDSAKEKPLMGKVICVGPGKSDEKMYIKPGQIILHGKHAGAEIKIQGKTYVVLRQSDIYAIL